MQSSKKVGVFITLFALSLSSVWAAPGFTAKAKLDGFKVVPPALTPKQTATLTLKFRRQPPAAAGETFAQRPPRPPRRGNVWDMSLTEPSDQTTGPVTNIRLYLGQPFANGRPIATLCDNDDTDRPICTTEDEERMFEEEQEFELNDILFQGQRITSSAFTTIAGITLSVALPTEKGADIVEETNTAFRLQNTENALKLIRTLIKRGLIYAVVNSEFIATVRGGEIIGYEPRRGVIDRDGEMRGRLCLPPKGSQCPRNE